MVEGKGLALADIGNRRIRELWRTIAGRDIGVERGRTDRDALTTGVVQTSDVGVAAAIRP